MSDDSELPPLDDDLRSLLRGEATRPAPEAEVSQALWSRLEATLGLPTIPSDGGGGGAGDGGGGSAAANGLGAGATAAGAKTLATAALMTKLLVSGALVGSGMLAGAGMHATLRSPEVQVVTRTVEVKVPIYVPVPAQTATPTLPQAQAPEAIEVAPSTPRAAAASARDESSPAPDRDRMLEQENALISRAQSALMRREPALALSALEEHVRKFEAGQLLEEREALWVQALALAGRHDAAAQRAERFKKRFPRSMLTPAVDAALAGGR